MERTAGAVVLARLDIDDPALQPLVQQMQARRLQLRLCALFSLHGRPLCVPHQVYDVCSNSLLACSLFFFWLQITSVPVMYLIAGGRLLDTKQGVPPQQVRALCCRKPAPLMWRSSQPRASNAL